MDDDNPKEDLSVTAYYISQKKYSYEQLCWMLAEMQMGAYKEAGEPLEDTLKFFQNFLSEMIDLGGPNLPKSVSARLGAKLASHYKKIGFSDINEGLKKSYEVLRAKPTIKKIDDNTIEVKVEHLRNFCPIGGGFKSTNKAQIIQNSICTPYTLGFLNALDPSYRYEGDIKECILTSKRNVCRYLLHLKSKENR